MIIFLRQYLAEGRDALLDILKSLEILCCRALRAMEMPSPLLLLLLPKSTYSIKEYDVIPKEAEKLCNLFLKGICKPLLHLCLCGGEVVNSFPQSCSLWELCGLSRCCV